MLTIKVDHLHLIFKKNLAAAVKVVMKMNCAVKTVALLVRIALNKTITNRC